MARKAVSGHMAGNVNVPISCIAADKLKQIIEHEQKKTGYNLGPKAVMTKILLEYKLK